MADSNPRSAEGPDVLPERQRRRAEEQLRLRHRDVPEACKIDPGNLTLPPGAAAASSGGSSTTTRRRSAGWSAHGTSRSGCAQGRPRRRGSATHVLEVCEEAFVHNPWDVGAVRDRRRGRRAARHDRSWRSGCSNRSSGQANDADFFRHLAHVHELNEAWHKAIQGWERVKKIDPNDEDASRQINALSANATIQRSGLGEAIDKAASEGAGPKSPRRPSRGAQAPWRSRPRSACAKEIQEHPSQVGPTSSWPTIFKMRDQLDDAEKVLGPGPEGHPGRRRCC